MAAPITWPEQEARRIVDRWPEQESYLLQTGFGPSGHPHMGTVGEVVRTFYVAMGLAKLGKRAEILVFSDDMDGLRKIPQNINAPQLEAHLGKPVSRIPDPYGCCASFSGHMIGELHGMLTGTGIPYRFVPSSEMYGQGQFDPVLRLTFRHAREILDLILPTMRAENRSEWFFFQPACESCGKVNTTIVEDYDMDTCMVRYADIGEFRGVKGCGYRGEQSALGGRGKLGWKVDWAARWYTFGVHYEMYGKDLIESAKLARNVLKILGGKAPVDMFYELFLDEEGHKISKSIGQGVTIENFGRWGTQDAVNLLMFKNPRQQKRLGADTIVQYMDEAMTVDRADPQYPFIYWHGERPDLGGLRYSDLVGLMSAIGVNESDLLKPYLERTLGTKRIEGNWDYVRTVLEKAINYYNDFILPQRQVPELTAAEVALVDQFLDLIGREETAEAIQHGVYEIAKAHGVPARAYFKVLYGVMLGQESGPRVGGLVAWLGREKIREVVLQNLGRRA